MKKLFAITLILIMTLSLTACGGNNNVKSSSTGSSYIDEGNSIDENNSTNGNKNNDTDNTQQGRIINVTSQKFELSDGFIVPVEKQTTAPNGWIPITTAEEFTKINLNKCRKLGIRYLRLYNSIK